MASSLFSPQTFITEIEVQKLFNLYSYKLSVGNRENIDLSRLLILYGDNGSGKTTLLKLLFNLLSPTTTKGHRTFLARTPFKLFKVKLGTDIQIIIEKLDENLVGSYTATIIRNGEELFNGTLNVNEKMSITQKEVAAMVFTQHLADLDLTLYFLSDDRKTQSTQIIQDEQEHLLLHQEEELILRKEGRRRRHILPESSEQNLNLAIERLERWIRTEALKGSTEGEANTNTIYADIVKRIARAKGRSTKTSANIFSDIRKSLLELENRSNAYAEYSLISPLQVGGLITTLDAATGATRQIIANVLAPYVDGLRARMNALQDVQKLIQTFINSVNSFFHNKVISFDLSDGIQITSSNGERLRPRMLSSGERQLLLLFCNTITARNNASIFIIDEPELSLNIKWQRKLLQVLLDCTKDSAVQFVIATHSVELLTRHRVHVLRLSNEPTEPHHDSETDN
jgi:energy-coupling factor transporter ATP-binding protein EcfA2